jgi:hypothetical protein
LEHLKKLEQKGRDRIEAEQEKQKEQVLFDIEVRRDKREKYSLIISGIALGFSIAAFVLSLAQWLLR